MKLADLVSIFQGHNTVLFKLTGFGEAEYDTVDFADAFCEIEALQQENEQLQAQLESLRCTSCGEIPAMVSTDDGQLCEKCAEELGAVEMIDLFNYHNPADVEALRKAREAIRAAWGDGSANAAMDKASEALAEIDKAIGGKEDYPCTDHDCYDKGNYHTGCESCPKYKKVTGGKEDV